MGLVVLAAGALPHIATAPLANLYHAPGATPEDQAALVLQWQATQGIFDALLATGLLPLLLGVVILGAGMLTDPGFGRGFGALSVALGGIGVVAGGDLPGRSFGRRRGRLFRVDRLSSRFRMEALQRVANPVGVPM